MTASELITQFELQVNDITELSDVEELSILNRVYLRICRQAQWEFLKVNATGTILTDSVGSYIDVPSDFSMFSVNRNYTNNSISNDFDAAPKVIFVGPNYRPIQIVNYSDRRQYRNNNSYAYLDLANSKIYFCYPPVESTYDFDYIKVPAELTTNTSPIFPSQYHSMIPYAMATENDILQLSPKAQSYAQENQLMYKSDLNDMKMWNANLLMN